MAHDLGRHRGRSLVVAGETQPAEVQALAHLTNAALGNVGHTVAYVPAAEVRSEDQLASLHELVDDMAAGRVELLVVLGGDPAFNAPADLPFAEAMAKVPLRVHLSLYANDTAARSHWVVPAAHYLESWGDVRAFDGTVTIVQPLIAPLYAGESAPELLAVLAEGPTRAGYDIVRTDGRPSGGPPTSTTHGGAGSRPASSPGRRSRRATSFPAGRRRRRGRAASGASRSSFVPIRWCTTGASRRTPGSRSCRVP